MDHITGYNLIVETRNGAIEAFLPGENSDQVYLKPDYQIDIETLQEFVECESRKIEIDLDSAETDRLTAARVTVIPAVAYGIVNYANATGRYIVTNDGKKIYVADDEDAKIIKLSYCQDADDQDDNDHQKEVDFSEIQPGDKIKAYGLQMCSVSDSDDEFAAYFVIVRSPRPHPEHPETVVIKRNKVTIFLPAREYNKNLVILGNQVRVVGSTTSKVCEDSQDWAVIRGEVEVNGNKAEFHNIWFEGDVVIKGNNAKFENGVFEGVVVDLGHNTSRNTCMD